MGQGNGSRRSWGGVAVLLTAAVAVGGFSDERGTGQRYKNSKFGFVLTVPSQFVAQSATDASQGGVWMTRDRKASLIAVAAANDSQISLTDYRDFVIAQSYKGAKLSYAPVKSSWFVLSGTMGETEFYQRITFVCGGRYIYGWEMVYPATARGEFDKLVEMVHRSYRPGKGEGGNCGRMN